MNDSHVILTNKGKDESRSIQSSDELFYSVEKKIRENPSKELEMRRENQMRSHGPIDNNKSSYSLGAKGSLQQQNFSIKDIKKEPNKINLRSQSHDQGNNRFTMSQQNLREPELLALRFQRSNLSSSDYSANSSESKEESDFKSARIGIQNPKPRGRKKKLVKISSNDSHMFYTKANERSFSDEATLNLKQKEFKNEYFHSINLFKKLEPEEIFYNKEDSEENYGDENEFDVIQNIEFKMLDEYMDIVQNDKEFFKIWNLFIKRENYRIKSEYSKTHKIPSFFESHQQFIKENKHRLSKELRLNFISHLVNLLGLNQLTREEINGLLGILNS